ncbi:DUF2515 family protein [Pontibacillus litoralis]|uniref:DUF2515 domain-containing protein n=1 Tax=Pontibacillus litoralis JSM 072002 TaxID=1385512 RepID=A0A0A5G487_9BACI|nr:DUF2515 family protein [Pontibacillus litoralis]KGX87931.1 hypothetical protein N784_12585 [Pontibacillus litoralis JSM 072002]
MNAYPKHFITDYIQATINACNVDNISRTKAYQTYYLRHPEIKWALLASIVSRNAGWNMTDLKLSPLTPFIPSEQQDALFSTYERANWLIFLDAYPQLLVYELSKSINVPLFHLLKHFSVSRFMQNEWTTFWYERKEQRLMTALIINEQNVIEQPVTRMPYYKRNVFHSVHYLLQDMLHLSAVLFPTRTGALYGNYVHHFSHLTNRITIGKQLASLLFHQQYYPYFLDFVLHTEPIGVRYEYEQYFYEPQAKTPILRQIYPIIKHKYSIRDDWYRNGRSVKRKWWKTEEPPIAQDVSHMFYAKRHVLYALHNVVEAYKRK